MAQDKLIKLKCTTTGDIIWSRKNRKNTKDPIELKKFNKRLKQRTIYKESKK